MLDTHFSIEQKASILAVILRESQNGHDIKACCRAQGLTYQTFLDWRQQAVKRHALDVDLKPTKAPKMPAAPLKTAMQVALEAAQLAGLPKDNPEDLAALAHDDGPAKPAKPLDDNPTNPTAAERAALEAAIAEHETPAPSETPLQNDFIEGSDMPKKKDAPPVKIIRGRAAQAYVQFPWLAAIEQKTEQIHGPRPPKKSGALYYRWSRYRRSLMTPEQIAELDQFYKAQKSEDAAAEDSEPEAAPPARKTASQLQAERDFIDAQLAAHADHAAPKPPKVARPRKVTLDARASSATDIDAVYAPAYTPAAQPSQVQPYNADELYSKLAEIDRLKKALTALTMENLQLRGLL